MNKHKYIVEMRRLVYNNVGQDKEVRIYEKSFVVFIVCVFNVHIVYGARGESPRP